MRRAAEIGRATATAAPSGTASARRQRPKPSSSSGSTSAPVSTIWFWPGDAEVDVAGRRPHRDVVGARQQQVEIEVVGVRVQRPARRLELDAGVAQEPRRGLREPALGGQREPQQPRRRHARLRASRSSTRR